MEDWILDDIHGICQFLKQKEVPIIEMKKIVGGEVREEKSKGTGRITAPHAMYQVIMIKKLSIFSCCYS